MSLGFRLHSLEVALVAGLRKKGDLGDFLFTFIERLQLSHLFLYFWLVGVRTREAVF
jgi:hypothetical protein|tara:strand:+ start:7607 stop:7777 length:171 start_codon:yes stop_codon:yes gene_type:complete